jgi:hypothetical protein
MRVEYEGRTRAAAAVAALVAVMISATGAPVWQLPVVLAAFLQQQRPFSHALWAARPSDR